MNQTIIDNLTDVYISGLHKRLKNCIDASIFVTIDNDDTLYVRITKFDRLWLYKHSNVSNDILYGNTDGIVNAIIREYKRDVLSLYFY